MKKLFENPGKKVKLLAKVLFCVLAAAAIVGFIIICCLYNWRFIDSYWSAYSGNQSEINWALIGGSFGTLIVGLISAWVSGVVLYAFGDLVENTAAIRETKRSRQPFFRKKRSVKCRGIHNNSRAKSPGCCRVISYDPSLPSG